METLVFNKCDASSIPEFDFAGSLGKGQGQSNYANASL